MTTTPTEYPELPGLDNLETQARAADQDGQHIYTNPRDSNNWRANEIWHYLASPAAVLALIALARRAQPEGEAPQAEPFLYVRQFDIDHAKLSRTVLTARAPEDEFNVPLFLAATLSPLCGAQYAESGKEAAAAMRVIGGQRWSKEAEMTEGWLAAQQVAAPCSLAGYKLVPDEPTDQMTYIGQKMRYDPLNSIGSIYCAMLEAAPSAPGTPEAPTDRHPVQPLIEDEHGRARFKKNAIVRHLSEGKLNELAALGFPEADWEQFAQLIGYSLDGFGTLSYVTDETYDRAAEQPVLTRTAQLDGGQEGSDHG